MSYQLDIQPRELKFIVEANKQSKSSIQLVNKTDQYVAFKVKTTSPKKYCVKPNVGVIVPKGSYEFVVIMQAPKEVPLDLTCKDKFLIQNTTVPAETKDENITSEMFSRESGKTVEERKLRVILATTLTTLTTASQSSLESAPVNEAEKKAVDQVEVKTVHSEEAKPVKDLEVAPPPLPNVNLEPIKNVRIEPTKAVDPPALKDVESDIVKDIEPTSRKIADIKVIEPRVPLSLEEQRLFKEVEDMKFKLQELESKLYKTETTISKLTEEKKLANEEKDSMQQEMVVLKKRKVVRRVQDGFPLLFVFTVALISLVAGYGFHP